MHLLKKIKIKKSSKAIQRFYLSISLITFIWLIILNILQNQRAIVFVNFKTEEVESSISLQNLSQFLFKFQKNHIDNRFNCNLIINNDKNELKKVQKRKITIVYKLYADEICSRIYHYRFRFGRYIISNIFFSFILRKIRIAKKKNKN